MSIGVGVDASQQLFPLLGGNAALQDPQDASFVQLSANENKRFGTSGESSRLGWFRRQDTPGQAVNVGYPLVHRCLTWWLAFFYFHHVCCRWGIHGIPYGQYYREVGLL